MSDQATHAVLQKLDSAHELQCGGRTLMFNLDFDTDKITIRASSSREHVVRIPENGLLDYLNSLGTPISEALVVETLCDIYQRPERYGVRKLEN